MEYLLRELWQNLIRIVGSIAFVVAVAISVAVVLVVLIRILNLSERYPLVVERLWMAFGGTFALWFAYMIAEWLEGDDFFPFPVLLTVLIGMWFVIFTHPLVKNIGLSLWYAPLTQWAYTKTIHVFHILQSLPWDSVIYKSMLGFWVLYLSSMVLRFILYGIFLISAGVEGNFGALIAGVVLIVGCATLAHRYLLRFARFLARITARRSRVS